MQLLDGNDLLHHHDCSLYKTGMPLLRSRSSTNEIRAVGSRSKGGGYRSGGGVFHAYRLCPKRKPLRSGLPERLRALCSRETGPIVLQLVVLFTPVSRNGPFFHRCGRKGPQSIFKETPSFYWLARPGKQWGRGNLRSTTARAVSSLGKVLGVPCPRRVMAVYLFRKLVFCFLPKRMQRIVPYCPVLFLHLFLSKNFPTFAVLGNRKKFLFI